MDHSKWVQVDLKNTHHEPMMGQVYREMHGPFSILVGSNVYNGLRGPLSRSLFLNLQIVLEEIGHRTKWVRHV